MGEQPRPPIVTLCGSTSFKLEFRAEEARLALDGVIVLSVGLFGHADAHTLTIEEKRGLDALHRRKIDLSDSVHVINVRGYIGNSTRTEIDYATGRGVPVTYMEALSDG